MKFWHKIPGTRTPGKMTWRIRWNRLRYHLTGQLPRWTQEDVDRINRRAKETKERLDPLIEGRSE